MEQQFNALDNTRFSQKRDSSKPRDWRTERAFLASKTCDYCGNVFLPKLMVLENGKTVASNSESHWNKQEFCSISCSKKKRNPMASLEAREKMRMTLKNIRHQPMMRGGNGQLPSIPQLALWHALGEGWEMEFSVATRKGHLNGVYPNHYKIDIANKEKMIAIEVDGTSHNATKRKQEDNKKTEVLKELGWSVYRVSNEDAIELYTTFMSVDTLLISLMTC